MNRYINKLNSFLAEQSANFPFDDAHSVLDVLCYYYCSVNSVDNAVIRCQFKELNDILSGLSLEENDAVFSLTGDLCTSHMRKAFLDGVHAGMCLFHELNNQAQ